MGFYCFLISVNPVGFLLLVHQCQLDGFLLLFHSFLHMAKSCCSLGVHYRGDDEEGADAYFFCSDTAMYHLLYSLRKAPLFLLLTNGWIIGRVQRRGEASLLRAEG